MPYRPPQFRRHGRQPDGRLPAHKRGYNHDWYRLKERHLAEFPYCERCAEKGITVYEDRSGTGRGRSRLIVDHKKPVHVFPHLRLDPENVQTLCRPCHKLKTDADQVLYGT